jgi:RNA polymerase sigma factor (TIGR02999 family)
VKVTVNDLESLFSELRLHARGVLTTWGEKGKDLRPTELVLTALRRVRGADREWDEVSWENRSHFFSHVHQAMRSALIDHARKRHAQRRPQLVLSGPESLDFTNLALLAEETPERVIALEEALEWLDQRNPELALLIRHHYFTGETVEEIGLILAQPPRTVRRHLTEARMLLHRKIGDLLTAALL